MIILIIARCWVGDFTLVFMPTLSLNETPSTLCNHYKSCLLFPRDALAGVVLREKQSCNSLPLERVYLISIDRVLYFLLQQQQQQQQTDSGLVLALCLMSCFPREQCRQLMEALHTNTSVKDLEIHGGDLVPEDQYDVLSISSLLQRSFNFTNITFHDIDFPTFAHFSAMMGCPNYTNWYFPVVTLRMKGLACCSKP
jgi:hypothetical protein